MPAFVDHILLDRGAKRVLRTSDGLLLKIHQKPSAEREIAMHYLSDSYFESLHIVAIMPFI